MDVTLRKANEHRNEWFEGVYRCKLDETLFTVIEKFVKFQVSIPFFQYSPFRSLMISGLVVFSPSQMSWMQKTNLLTLFEKNIFRFID